MDHNSMIIGSRVEGGTATKFETGDWRSVTPRFDKSLCTNCLTCWIYCPDDCIIVKDEKVVDIKLTHCKGCGVCESSCPKKAIKMCEE